MLTAELFKQEQKNCELYLLKHDLSNFGLLPTQWKLEEVIPSIYKISNKFDPDYSFIGHIKSINGIKTWSSIELYTL